MSDHRSPSFRAAVYPHLQSQYGASEAKLLKECPGADGFSEQDRINFLFELDQIVGSYKKRYDDPEYLGRLKKCQEELAKASSLLEESVQNLSKLDANHTLVWGEILFNLRAADLSELLPSDELDLVGAIRMLSKSANLALRISTGLLILWRAEASQGRGRPSVPYLLPTMELIEFWEQWSNHRASFAKRAPRGHPGAGELTDHFPEFVRLALKLIDPSVTTANAVTSINKVLKFRQSIEPGVSGIEYLERMITEKSAD
jgi:hypothetical protein